MYAREPAIRDKKPLGNMGRTIWGTPVRSPVLRDSFRAPPMS
jgi:hypothetical protein